MQARILPMSTTRGIGLLPALLIESRELLTSARLGLLLGLSLLVCLFLSSSLELLLVLADKVASLVDRCGAREIRRRRLCCKATRQIRAVRRGGRGRRRRRRCSGNRRLGLCERDCVTREMCRRRRSFEREGLSRREQRQRRSSSGRDLKMTTKYDERRRRRHT